MPARETGPPQIYQIKVTLNGTKPPIWRRLLVGADLTLERLHFVLQVAMGWEDCHLHDFRIGQKVYGPRGSDDALMGSDVASERSARVGAVLGKVGAKAVYTYDFGDGWEHSIQVEKLLPPEPGLQYPLCVGGKLNGPPEDCGGIWGFYEMIEALGDPDHARHEEIVEWIGEYDPNAFSADEVNVRLAPLRRRAKSAKS